MNNIVIVDYGAGNLQSVVNALKYLGVNYKVSNKIDDLRESDGIILPGVGAFGSAMKRIEDLNILSELTDQVVKNKKPFLGICLGLQLLFESSEETPKIKGFCWLEGNIKLITYKTKLPHVGWNNLENILNESKLFKDIDNKVDFYFDHSYHVICNNKYVTSHVEIIDKNFSIASIEYENIYAVQFHPEKSQQYGLLMIKNFMDIVNGNKKC